MTERIVPPPALPNREMQPVQRIKGIIFDVDGTMVRSERLHVAAWEQSVREFGSVLPESIRSTMAGRKPAAIAAEIAGTLSLSISSEALLQRKTELFMQSIETGLEEMPGLTDVVKQLHEKGYRLGIGTSTSADYISLVLQRLGLKDMFDVIVTGDQVTKGKPDPETYQKVVEQLGLQPSECVVIEDATNGILAAKSAGCHCIAIEDTDQKSVQQDLSLADARIASFTELEQTLRRLSGEKTDK